MCHFGSRCNPCLPLVSFLSSPALSEVSQQSQNQVGGSSLQSFTLKVQYAMLPVHAEVFWTSFNIKHPLQTCFKNTLGGILKFSYLVTNSWNDNFKANKNQVLYFLSLLYKLVFCIMMYCLYLFTGNGSSNNGHIKGKQMWCNNNWLKCIWAELDFRKYFFYFYLMYLLA